MCHIGSVVPFSNPSGILIFVEESVERINLTLLSNNTLEVCTYVRMYGHNILQIFIYID